MKVTVVLITQPSRFKYFKYCLQSVEVALKKYLWLELLIVLNGKSPSAEVLTRKTIDQFPERVNVEVLDKNAKLGSPIWPILAKYELEWVNYLGDDDVLLCQNLSMLPDLIRKHSSVVAIGFAANVINESGQLTGKVLRPAIWNLKLPTEVAARSLHEPPFVWPALVWKLSALPEEPFLSRFVSDWWVGLNLIQNRNYLAVDKPLIEYRTHSEQESALALERRKRFEAHVMIHHFLDKGFLAKAIRSTNELETFIFNLKKYSPIYGDPEFGASIFLRIINSLSLVRLHLDQSSLYLLSQFAAENGVFLPMEEFPRSVHIELPKTPDLNINISYDNDICEPLKLALTNLRMQTLFNPQHINCQHSIVSYDKIGLLVDCSAFANKSAEFIVAKVLQALSNADFTQDRLTGKERKVLFILRKSLSLFRKVFRFFQLR